MGGQQVGKTLSPRGAASAASFLENELPQRERRLSRTVWSFAKGSHCFSVGFLAFGLTGLLQPEAVHRTTAAPPGPLAPPGLVTVAAPARPEPPLAAPLQPAPPSAAEPKPQSQTPAPTPDHPAPAAPAAIPAITAKLETLLPLDFEEHGIPEAPFGNLIYEMAGRYKLNPYLVAAVVQVESAFNPRALSPKGARGLMQLLPETARRFGLQRKKDLFNPAKNLEAGVRYLKWLSERFSGDAARVLAAYNAGEGAVDRFGGVPPYQETRNYVTRIFGLLGLVPALEGPPALQEDAVAAGR